AFLISPLTVYSFMPLADVVAEHRAYIAGLSFDLLAAWLVTRKMRHAPVAVVSVSLLLGILTIQRNNVWANNAELWKDAARKSPNLVRPAMNLGSAYEVEGKQDAALEEYQRAVSINPRLPAAYNNIGEIYLSRQNLEQAEANFRKAVEL